MSKRQVFYSFHFDNDVMRVQLIRNIGLIEDNKPVTVNTWEGVKRQGRASIEKWINDNLQYKSCIVVLVGSDTANRPWVQYEIEKAWNAGKGVVGIHIHNLKCPRNGTSIKGKNPFQQFPLQNGKLMSNYAKCYNPPSSYAYTFIKDHLAVWIEEAIKIRNSI